MATESEQTSKTAVLEAQSERGNNSKPSSRTKPKRKPSVGRPSDLRKRIAELEEEKNAFKDQLLRKAAEFENFRKRRESEFLQLIANSNAELITQLLPILDDYERSLKSAQERKDFDSFFKGIELIFKNLVGLLEKQGVKPIDAVGKTFDPELHDALMQVESDEHPPGTVVEEHLRGYTMHDRVLRHSQVLVSK